MSFQDFEARFAQLYQQYQQRRISPQDFALAVNQLRLQDGNGIWWQMDQNGGWLRWDGRNWSPAMPPRYAAPQSQPPVASRAYTPAYAPAAAQRAAAVIPKPPESLLDLLKIFLGGMFKNFFTKAILAFVTLMFVWVLHTILLIGPNGGFGSGTSWVLDSVLALQGRMTSGTLFWGMLFGLVAMVIARTSQLGLTKTMQSVASTPGWLVESFRQSRVVALPLLFGNAALTLIIGTILDNRLVSLLLLAFGVVELTAQANSLPGLIVRLGWGDVQRMMGGIRHPYNPAWTAPSVVGLLVGFMAAVVLPFVPWCGFGFAFILFAMMGLTIALMIMKPRAGVVALVFLFIFFASVTPVLADDGGWAESGSTLGGWLQSEGAVQAVLQGLPPAAAAALLGWLAATLGQSLGAIYQPGMANITSAQVAAALPTALGLTNLGTSLEALNQNLLNQHIYVRNFFQGDPTLIGQGLYNLVSIGWDNLPVSPGYWLGSQGFTCGDYVDRTLDPVKSMVQTQFPGAKVQSIVFEEKSSKDPQGLLNNIDALNTENHNLIKVTLPDGSEYAVDFHQHNAHITSAIAPPILRPWNEARQEWVNYLGKNEFTERVDR